MLSTMKISIPTLRRAALVALALAASACSARPSSKAAPSSIQGRLRAQMGVLAGDAMRGRGSGTPDELRAGQYIARELLRIGVKPMGDAGANGKRTYIQSARLDDEDGQGEGGSRTWNVIGMLPGRAGNGSREVILLSAHMDHLGTREVGAGEDGIYNGADDDASGCVAVLELARSLARGPKLRRTVYFVFFGSEEKGGLGARYFLSHLPFAQPSLVANLEFEMIGRPDPAVARDALWLTGYERSNLGPQLAQHGARLVADPHPEQSFFTRSDNYALARRGVIAHTVSSFGLHRDYHQPSDEVAGIDFAHMARAIASLEKPVRWLADASFQPTWNPGQQP